MKKHLLLFSLLSLLCFCFPHYVSAQLNEYFSISSSWAGAKTTVTFNGNPQTNIEYSTDKVSWTPITQTTEIPTYNKTYFRGTNPNGFSKSKTDYVNFVVNGSSQNFYLEGNIMSLVNGNDFATNYSTIPSDYCFYALFTDCLDDYNNNKTVAAYFNAENLLLPANNLTSYCYAYMFKRTYIKTPPQLPAQNLAPYCYAHMFYHCISLDMRTSYPAKPIEYILPAEELAPHCYEHMFGIYNSNPTMYQYITMMATSLQDRCGQDIENCLREMFYFGVALPSATNKNVRYFLQLFFTDWGDVDKSTCPTYNWFGGNFNAAYNYFFYDTALPYVVSKIAAGKSGVRSQFPTGAYSCETNNCTSFWVPAEYGYLTFDCKTNGGTWEQGCEYNADLRRVVRSDYKAKTVPAAPVKADATFKGWYTQPTGGTKVEEATILNQTTAQTYYAQFGDGNDGGDDNGGDNPQDGDDTDLSNIKMSRGVLDMPTYYSFAILGENKNVTVRLHFNTYLTTNNTNYLNNLTYDIANSYIQPAGGEKRQIASASQAKVEYLGDAYRAAHLTAKVTDTDGNDYNIDIFTNEELNAATYEDVIGTNYKSIVETSWRTCNPFHIYGTQNNEMDRLIYRNPSGRHILYMFHGDYGVNLYYEVLHVQIELFPDASKPGKIPTGIYPINATQEVGTAFIGRCPDDIIVYEQNQRQPYCGSFVQYELQATENDYYPNRDVWVLRDGYVEVVNVDEKYWVHVHAYADAHRTTNEECAVIDYTACLDDEGVTYTPVDVTLSAQTEDGAQLDNAATMLLKDATDWTSALPQGEYKFFTGNTLTLNAAKSGYEFSHWLINGSRVDGNNIDYTVASSANEIIAVFTGDGNGGEGGDDPDPETPIVSADEYVLVYQNVAKTTTKILYNLDLRQGKDGLWYKPTDMGYGIAWADRNVGAASVNATGDYYNWGDPVSEPLVGKVYSGVTSLNAGYILPAEHDAATVKMGKDWHTPTYDEWYVLILNASMGNNRLNNPDDESLYINMPPTGYYEYYQENYFGGTDYVGPYLNNQSYAFYWSSELMGINYSQALMSNAGMVVCGDGEMEIDNGYIYLAAPVRAVYTPPFTTYTLTIHVGNYDYHYICQQGQKVTVTAIATEEGAEFIKWEEDGLTDAVRTFTVNADMTYTAIFTENDTPDNPETPEMSPDAEVNVYQSVTKSTMKILYDLSPKQGNDGLWYTPVDLGYGVAWADRNVGASSPNVIGDYFRWGDPVAGTSFSSDHQRNLNVTGYHTYDRLTDTQDAAIVNMGNKWRMPDEEDFYQLKEQAVITNNNTFTNKDDNSLSILLPAGGYKGAKLYDQGYQYYWSRQYSNYGRNDCSSGMGYSYEEHSCFALVRSAADNKYYVNNKDKDDCFGNEPYLGMPVRALYVPPFEVCTLTINVEGYQYVYLCQAGQNVTVTAIANEGYEFDRWTEDGNTEAVRTFTVNGNMTYTATFKQAKQEYNIIYKDKGGAAFSGTHASGYPTVHTYGTATTLKSATKEGYNFLGWFTDINCTGTAVTSLGATAYTSDITLYAAWEEVKPDEPDDPVNDDELHIILYEDKDADYYTDFSNKYNGKRATTVTYNRQFEQSKWSTMCLPFNVNSALISALKMTSRVYEFKYTKGDEQSGLTLYFSQAKKLEAGKGYIVNANAALAQSKQFIFPDVVINTEADINSGFDLTNIEGYNSQGDVYLAGTLRTGLLVGSQTGNRYMGLKNNKIYFPNVNEGTNILAYRGIFRSSVAINAQRVRIVVEDAEGERESELEVVNGELQEKAETRKFVENGILYIEREGKRYTAQGAVMK